jgi:hypothetical protein
MTTSSNLTSDAWPADVPEADAQEQLQAAYPEPAQDPEEPLPPGEIPVPAAEADEADLVEQARELPWEDSDEER